MPRLTALLDRLTDLATPRLLTIAVVAILGTFFTLLICAPVPSPKPAPDLLAAVRADIQSISTGVGSVASEVQSSNGLLTEIRDVLTALKDQAPDKGRRQREVAETSDPQPSTLNSQPSPPLCLKLPNGPDTDLTRLTAQATGRFTVEGMTYRQALALKGFDLGELALIDEPTAQQVYDGWMASQPQNRYVSVPRAAPVYQCNGRTCRRVR